MATRAQSNVTTDHDEIRQWAETRDAQPSCVKGTGNEGDIGMLRLDFPGFSGEESLQHISWDDWFEKFDERNLALLYQEMTAGGARSNFNKLVSRETAQAAESKAKGRSATTGRSKTARGKGTGASGSRKAAKPSTSARQATKSTAKKASASRAGSAAKRAGTAKKSASSSRASTASRGASASQRKSPAGKRTGRSAARKTTGKSSSSRSR